MNAEERLAAALREVYHLHEPHIAPWSKCRPEIRRRWLRVAAASAEILRGDPGAIYGTGVPRSEVST